jgi:signal transduction histidine kinase
MFSVDDMLAELSDIFEYYNDLDDHASYGLIVTPKDRPPININPSAPAHISLAEAAISQLDVGVNTQELPLPEAGEDPKSLYLWRIALHPPAPMAVAWCIATKEKEWEPFFPLRFTELGQLSCVYLNSCLSAADPYYLIASAFESGAAKLALNMMRNQAKADSAILWLYQPQAHYFQARTIVGATSGRYVTGVGKGIVGQISPTNRIVTVDLTEQGSLRPFHPDLFRSEKWARMQYVGICSEGRLLGAVGLYWRAGNRVGFVQDIDALRMASLATIMFASEQAQSTVEGQLASLEQLIIRLTPAQALISFLHDIQRSLRDVTTAMNGAAVLLDKSSNPERKSIAAQLSRSADFVDGCMNRMARLALLQEKVSHRKRTDLQRLLQSLIPVLVSHSVVEVSVDPGGQSVWIRADRLSIERAILNIVTNAVYWTETKPHGERRVSVRLSARDTTAVIEVEDTGLGVGAEVRDRIFEKFVSGRPNSGTGMGLYIVRETVESHGGEISFFTNRRHGTTFRLTFPLMEAK